MNLYSQSAKEEDMTYYDIVKTENGSKDAMWKSVKRMSEFLEEVANVSPSMKEKVDLIKIETHGDMSNGHFFEDGAKYALSSMKPVILMMNDKPVNSTMWDYMYDNGLTPNAVHEAVEQSYMSAKEKLAKLGKQAPVVPPSVNEWDMFVTMAMVLADNPISIGGDIMKGAMLTYEYLSDPDGEDDKIWKYIFQ